MQTSGWAVILLFAGLSVALSQPPSKAPAVKRNLSKQQAADLQKQLPANERGTEQSPVIVRVLPNAKTQEETAAANTQELNKSSADWWLVRLTGALALIGLLQTIVFGIQARRLKESVDAAKESADALKNAERAWLQIRTDGFGLKQTHRIDWAVRNEGRTTATITEANLRCRFLTGRETVLPPVPDYGRPIELPKIPIAPHNTVYYWSYIDTPETEIPGMGAGLTQGHIEKITSGRAELVIYGYVKYVDAFGGTRESRFCDYFATYCNEFRTNLQAPVEHHRCT